jgi:SAM-dependent methyltransferase
MIDASKFNLDAKLEAQLEALVGPPGQWQARRDLQLAMLDEFGLTPDTRFLDLGCGTLRLGLPLIDHLAVGRYTGVDIDPDCIAAARMMLGHFDLHQKAPNIVHSRSFGFDELNGSATFDMIWIFQVFIHLTDEHVRNAMRAMSALLAEGGTAYGTAFVNDRLETLNRRGNWRHYALAHGPLSYYRDRAAEVGLALEAAGAIDKDGWVEPTQPLRLTMLKMLYR